jgi:cytoskeleton protein RodZ
MSDVQEETQIGGPGQLLKSARQQAKLSVEDIAQKLHLKPSVISDIEDDNYAQNISLTFIKGYLKLYAKQVMVTEAEVISAFETLNTQKKEPAKLQSFSRRVANQANDDKLMMVSYMILAVVLALVVVWWFQQSDNDVTTTLPQIGEPGYSVDANKDQNPSASLESVIHDSEQGEIGLSNEIEQLSVQGEDTLGIVDKELPASASPDNMAPDLVKEQLDSLSPPPASAITAAGVAEPKTQALPESVELVFEFSADCWIKLSDATGNDIAYGVKAAGRVMTVSGVPPFTVTLGAPEVVQISYASEAINMSIFTAGNIAKFTLPMTP